MGASLDTPAACPLCQELLRDPVVLKCKHRFCHGCIGDLWSGSPTGPYHCPEWRCKTVYKTLPFERHVTRPSTSSQGARSRNTTGTREVKSNGSNPSVCLLGKRKACAPVEQQPETKRPAVDNATVLPNDGETPTGSSPVTAGQEDSSQADAAGSLSSSTDEAHGSGAPEDVSIRRDKTETDEVVTDDFTDDFSSDVEPCAEPSPTTSGKELEETGEQGKPPSPVGSDPIAAASASGGDQPSVRRTVWPPSVFTKRPLLTTTTKPTAGPVPCNYCPSAGHQSAVKTCLVCGASMCAEHLRPHLDSPVFRNHTLVAPIDDLSSWRCPDHQEISRIYCRQCALCVCTVCTVIGSHRDHTCISIRDAEAELRGNLKEEIKQLQETELALVHSLSELKQKKEELQGVLDVARDGVQQQYGAMREALEQEERSALQCVIQEETRAIGGLEGHLSRLKRSLTCVQKGLHTLEGLSDAKGDQRVQEQAFIREYSKITQMFSDLGPSIEELDTTEEVDRARLNYLQRWTEKRLDTLVISLPDRDPYRLLYGTIPSLDMDTAHPKLVLSENNRRVVHSEVQQAYAEHRARFSVFPQVLASRAVEKGRWYWEVEVSSEEGRWKVGLCEAQMGRKGQKDGCRLGFNPYSWCLGSERGKVEVMHDKVSVSVSSESLQRIGVFLDFDEGVLSFFSVTPAGGSLALLHSYRQRFTEPLYPAFSVSKAQLTICDLFKMSTLE